MTSSNDRWDEFLSRWEAAWKRERRDVSAQELWPDAPPEELAELERRLQGQRLIRDFMNPSSQVGPPTPAETLQVPDGYKLIKWLGRGGYGEVLEVQRQDGEHVALKFVDLTGWESQVEMAAQEIMKDRKHPTLVETFNAWKTGRYLVIEMQLAIQSLRDRFREVTEGGQLGIDADELLVYLNDAARGIDFLNERRHAVAGQRGLSIAHCDIKPENLLLFNAGVKVADFGLVRALRRTLTGHFGPMTPPYAAPELFRGETSARSDQYSLAVTYCVLRAGRFPITGKDNADLGRGHLDRPPDLTMLPEEERYIVARALDKTPEARWPGCQEFVASLQGARHPQAVIQAPAAPVSMPASLPELSPYFTGREAELNRLRSAFTEESGEGGPRIQILSGQGGNGKTQLALKYVFRYRKEYTATFWVHAASSNDCMGGFAGVARQLGLPRAQEIEQEVAAARGWLDNHPSWLLILDNADEPELVKKFLPRNGGGHILMTSRAQLFDVLGAKPVRVNPLNLAEAVEFLLKRTDLQDPEPTERGAAGELAAELGCLPLALEQAGAYILENLTGFQDYLTTYSNLKLGLLEKKRPVAGDYRESVRTTWRLNFAQIEAKSPAAADLLRVSALLYPEAIPFDLLEQGAEHLGSAIAQALASRQAAPVAVYELLAHPARYSLIRRDRDSRTYSIHRLVQEVIRETLGREQTLCWAERVVRAMAVTFPGTAFSDWPLCEQLLPHAVYCAGHVKEWELSFRAAGKLVSDTGAYLAARGQFVQSEPLLRHALAIREKTLGPEHPEVAQSLNSLAILLSDQGKYTEARPLFDRALTIREQTVGPEHPDVAMILHNLAVLLQRQGKIAEAQTLCERALTIREKTLGPELPDVAESLRYLAILLFEQGKNTDAEPLFDRALAILKKALGPEHPYVAKCLYNLAVLLQRQGKFTEALPVCEQALAIFEQALGPEHPDVAMSLNNMAVLVQGQGKYSEVLPLCERALAIFKKALGPEHPLVAASLNGLAVLLYGQGKYTEAQPLYERALAIREKALGPGHSRVAESLYNLAELLNDLGKNTEAQLLCERALAIFEKALGPEHPHVARNLDKLASILSAQGKNTEAQPLHERAQAIRTKTAGHGQPIVS